MLLIVGDNVYDTMEQNKTMSMENILFNLNYLYIPAKVFRHGKIEQIAKQLH